MKHRIKSKLEELAYILAVLWFYGAIMFVVITFLTRYFEMYNMLQQLTIICGQ